MTFIGERSGRTSFRIEMGETTIPRVLRDATAEYTFTEAGRAIWEDAVGVMTVRRNHVLDTEHILTAALNDEETRHAFRHWGGNARRLAAELQKGILSGIKPSPKKDDIIMTPEAALLVFGAHERAEQEYLQGVRNIPGIQGIDFLVASTKMAGLASIGLGFKRRPLHKDRVLA